MTRAKRARSSRALLITICLGPIITAPSLGEAPPPAYAEPRAFTCKEPLPVFTLRESSNPSEGQLAKLCACIWSKFPEGGWEREVSAKLRKGEDAGWRTRGFPPRFGAAINACGGDKL